MRLDGELAERLRSALAAAELLTLVVFLPGAAPRQVVAQQVERPPAEPHGIVALQVAAQPVDPEALARLRYAGKSFRDWQELFLTDLEPATRLTALPALKKFGRYGYAKEAAETIAAAFADDDGELVTQAIDAAASIGADAVPALVEICKEAKGQTRRSAAQSLGKMGENAAGAVVPLFDLLGKIDGTRKDELWEHHYLLGALGGIGQAQMPVLLERLESPDRNTRVLAAYLLGQLGPGQPGPMTRRTTLLLRKAFKDDDAAARAVVGVALWHWAPTDEKAMLALSDAIESDQRRVAAAIAAAIASTFHRVRGVELYSYEAADVVSSGGAAPEGGLSNGVSLLGAAIRTPDFLKSFSDRQAGREAETEQPVRWEFPGVAPSGCGDTAASFAFQVARGIESAQGRAKPLVPELIELAESDQEHVVLAAVDMLGKIGPDAAAALPVLREIVNLRQKQGAAPEDDALLRVALDTIIRLQPPEIEVGFPRPAIAAPAQ